MKEKFIGHLVVATVALYATLPQLSSASYQCGIRKHSFVQLVHRGWTVEEGQWPWHVAILHNQNYACGGTLLDEKHVLTAAHCVVNRDSGYALPVSHFKLHFGQQNLSSVTENVQIRDVRKVHVHPEHSTHRNDIAILVLRLPVRFTDYVIPICIDQKADIDLRNLEGERGWITGWGTTQTGSISDVLRTASLPVVGYLQCINDHGVAFGNLLNQNVFCAGDRNGTSPGTGDSGGGMYFSDGDRWVLRGIVSFAKADESKKEVDTSKFVIFVNVQRYLTWIREILATSAPQSTTAAKRISERECDRFRDLVRKRKNNVCDNSRYPHTVSLIYSDGEPKCSGVLVNEEHVLTACHCRSDPSGNVPVKVQIDAYGSIDVLKTVCHPEFTSPRTYHDLAVVKLDTPIQLSSNIIPACLASNWTENLYDTLVQTGYGTSGLTGIKKFIESEENQVISKNKCEETIPNRRRLPDGIIPGQLCVINTDVLRTSSSGSSGSPLQSVNTRSCMFTAVGLTSFGSLDNEGVRENNATVIDIYTRVSYYLDWIEHMVWSEEPSAETTTTTVRTESTTTRKLDYQTDFVFPDN